MKKRAAFIICLIFTFIMTSLSYAQLSPEHVSDKIVTHSYNLIDAYIKELPEPTSIFPNGMFSFMLNNDINIDISPAFIFGKVWRSMTFSYPDNSVMAIILDGPISGEPGIPNNYSINGAKQNLSYELTRSNMTVKRIFKDNVSLDLSLENDFQIFIDKMFDSIKLSTNLSTGPTPTGPVILPKGTLVKINPEDDKKPIEISGVASSVAQIMTKIDIEGEEKEVKINLDKTTKQAKMEINSKSAVTNEKLEIKEAKLYIETSAGSKELKITPSTASEKAVESGIENTKEIRILEEYQKPIYFITGTKDAKILFIISASMNIETKVNTETGEVISVNKPWWAFLAS